MIQGTLRWKEYPLNEPERFRLLEPALVLVSGRIYIHGGYGTSTGKSHFYYYCLKTRNWTPLTALQERYNHSVVLVDDSIYVFGGSSSRRSYLPIEAYSLVTNMVQEFDPCHLQKQLAAYVEPRREVIIFGFRTGIDSAQVLGFNVDTAIITPYKITGGEVPTNPFTARLVTVGRKFFYYSKPRAYGGFIYVLTLGAGHKASWSRLALKGATPPVTAFEAFQVVSGLILVFGGINVNNEIEEDIFLADPETLEAVKVGPTSVHAEIHHEGSWPPKPPVKAGHVASNGKVWFFGGRSALKIIELEFDRES